MTWKMTEIADLNNETAGVLLALNKEDALDPKEMDRDAVWWCALRSLVDIRGGDVVITGFGMALVEKLLSTEVAA